MTRTYSQYNPNHKHAVVQVDISGGGSESYSYDANGNMLAAAGRTLTWDIENRPTQVVSGTVTIAYVYDGDGNLAKKTVGGVSTVYVGKHYEKNTSTGYVTKYYYAEGRRIAMRHGEVVSFILSDHLGGTYATVDSDGDNPQYSTYYGYGQSRGSVAGVGTDRLYTGQRLESRTGLYTTGLAGTTPRWVGSSAQIL